MTFKRCWIGVCSNFSLTTNVNSYRRRSNSKPADEVDVRVLSDFKHGEGFSGSRVSEVNIHMLYELSDVSGVG